MSDDDKVRDLAIATAWAVNTMGEVLGERQIHENLPPALSGMMEALAEVEMGKKSPHRLHDICVDFDGVIHSYTSGWQGADVISDEPVEGAFEWLSRMVQHGDFRVHIYSSRSKEPGAVGAMKKWFFFRGLHSDVVSKLSFPTQKPAAQMTIDDRAFCFEGAFPSPRWILDFKPWNKR